MSDGVMTIDLKEIITFNPAVAQILRIKERRYAGEKSLQKYF